MVKTVYRKSLTEMKAERGWTAAEQQLLDKAHTGEVLIAEARPDLAEEDAPNAIRAELIRHVTLGGCEDCPVPDKGVLVMGAVIAGKLDLQGCDTPLDLRLSRCCFDSIPVLQDARLGAVSLRGCALPGLNAHRLRVTRDFLLDWKFHCTGRVNLRGAQIGGQMSCVDACFENAGEIALNMNAITIGADLFLSKGFSAKGGVRLNRASVTGQLACDAGRFDNPGGIALNMNAITIGADLFLHDGFSAKGAVNLTRGTIAGNVRCTGGRFEDGLSAEGMTVGAGFFWEKVGQISGLLDLTDAHVGRLQDDVDSWLGASPLFLNGFRYDRLSGGLRIDERIAWLSKKHEEVQPDRANRIEDGGGHVLHWELSRGYDKAARAVDAQPYTHLAKVLREQGVTQGAARVLEARDTRLSEATFQRALRPADGSLWQAVTVLLPAQASRLRDRVVMRPLFGFGHRPARALVFVLLLWLVNSGLYGMT